MGKYYHGSEDSVEVEEAPAFFKSKGCFYVIKPPANLLCSKCNEVAEMPHTVQWITYCKECKPSSAVFDENLSNQAQDLEVFCNNWAGGCSMKLKRRELADHLLNSCQCSEMKCIKTIFGCTFVGNKAQMAAHKCEVNTEFLVETLTKLVFEQQKDIKSLKQQLKNHDGYFLDFNDDVHGLLSAMATLKTEVDNKVAVVLEVGKTYFLPNKSIPRIDLSKEDIDLTNIQWTTESILDVLSRLKQFTVTSLKFPLDQLTATVPVLNLLVDVCLFNAKHLKVLTLVGDKSKNALPIQPEFISFLIRCQIVKLRFDGFANLYFDAYIRNIVQENKTSKIELTGCAYDIVVEPRKSIVPK